MSYRHVVEVPYKESAALDHHVIELFTADILEVLACVAYRYTERQFIFLHQLHGMTDFVIYAVSSPSVVCLLKSFQTDCGDEVLHSQHLLAELFVDHRSVGKCKELAVRMHLAYLEDIFLTNSRLAAGVDIHICSQFFSLTDDRINVLQAQIVLMSVLRRPAPGTVQIAGCGRIQQNSPGDIAVVFF